MPADRGVLFIATGEKYVAQAVERAIRIKEIESECSIALLSDRSPGMSVFDHELPIEEPEHALTDKVENLDRSPFEQTLFLDTDTFVVDEQAFDELWGLLERAPLAAAFDIARSGQTGRQDIIDSQPPTSFPMLNTGVLLYEQPAVDPLIERWREIHDEYVQQGEPNINDQIAFRRALWETDFPFTVLPPEYNFIVPSPQFAADEVRILHGNVRNYYEIAETVNEQTPQGGRAYHPVYTGGDVPVVDPWVAGANEGALLRATKRSIGDFGFIRTALYLGAGPNPITGREKIIQFFNLVESDGIIDAVVETVVYIRR
jgi:hypothetical protein